MDRKTLRLSAALLAVGFISYVLIGLLLVLYFGLDARAGGAAWVARLGAVSAAVSLGLYGVLQAVDGIALKQAVDAWVRAPHADKAARFSSAEAIRWLELPRSLGYLMGLSGVAYIVQGWVLGSERGLQGQHEPQSGSRLPPCSCSFKLDPFD
jgi:hypothetical protein